jgi:membrane-bound serine protease (ClpP class)
MRIFTYLILLINTLTIFANTNEKKLIYRFDINREIAPAAWRITQQAVNEAEKIKADYILLRLNTYGGMVDAADSIRTKLLNCQIPILVFIDNNAASAGALIAISGDSIYMRTGANIGAATVVDQQGKVVPDKYQSYMRSIMRSTAEAHGKKPVIKGKDTTWVWHRDPKIAEAMVDPRTYIKGINDTGKVLTMTTSEAIANGFCEGKAENIDEVIKKAGISNYEIKEYKITGLDSLMGFLMNPIVQGILIMIIVAGIYFEMQAPGLAFPIILAAAAALLYFAPLYLEGLAENWEIIIFIVGLILLALEIFVIPGFGVTGIVGIVFVLIGLTMAMVENITVEPFSMSGLSIVLRAFALVVISISLSFGISIYFGSKMLQSRKLGMALHAEQNKNDGYIGVDLNELNSLIGKTGIAKTVLRPSGMVEIDGVSYDAKSESGFIEQGNPVKVIKAEASQVYVVRS